MRCSLICLPLLVATVVPAAALDLYLDDSVGVSPITKMFFQAELARLAANANLSLRFVDSLQNCNESCVMLRVQPRNAAEETALGATRVEGGRMLPRIELYAVTIRRLLAVRWEESTMARAMARVACHELGHYLTQEQRHNNGAMRAGLTQTDLLDTRPGCF